MQENRLLGWKGRLLITAAIIVAYLVLGVVAKGLHLEPKSLRFLKLPTVITIGSLWTMRGYWLSWKDITFVALLSAVILHLLILATLRAQLPGTDTTTLFLVLFLGVVIEGLIVLGGLWGARFVGIYSGKLRRPD